MDLITPDFGLLFWQTVTLLVVLLVLGKFAWKPILNAIQKREEDIKAALQAAEEAKKIVTKVQVDKDILLKTAQKEREKIIEEAIATKQAILAEAQVEADKASKKAIEQTKIILKREKESVLAALKSEVATLSVQIAEKLLQKELENKDTQIKLVQQLIKNNHCN